MIPENSRFIRLTHNHNIKPFECSQDKDDIDLKEFLLEDSFKYSQQLLAVTYIIENDSDTIAYFSVSNDKISVEDAKGATFWKKKVANLLNFEKTRLSREREVQTLYNSSKTYY